MKFSVLYSPPKHSEIPITQLQLLFFSVLHITWFRVSNPPTKKSHFGFLDAFLATWLSCEAGPLAPNQAGGRAGAGLN